MKIYLIKKRKHRKYDSMDMAMAAAGIEMDHAPSGRPLVVCGPERVSHISLSDTKTWWAMLVAGCPCGLDIEEKTRAVSAASARKLHPSEQRYLSGLEAESGEWKREFLSIWVRKEAYMKYCGDGLALGLSRFCVLGEDLSYALRVEAAERPPALMVQADIHPSLFCALAFERDEPFEGCELVEYGGRAEKDIMQTAADLLAERAYTAEGLRKKLADRAYGEYEAAQTVERLKELAYIDDGDYARNFASARAAKGYSHRRIRAELLLRGAAEGDVKEALHELSHELPSERERAEEQALSMLEGEEIIRDDRTAARIGRRLSALGYDSAVIWDVLARLRK